MKTFSIGTLGCKVNQYESQQIRQLLEQNGLKPAASDACADIVLINTCCVTQIASSKSRQHVRKAQKQNPGAPVVIAGCLPAGPTEELLNIDGNVHIVTKKEQLAETISRIIMPGTADKAVCDTKTDIAERVNSGNASKTTDHLTDDNRTVLHPKIKHKNPVLRNDRHIISDGDTSGLEPLRSYTGQCRAFLKVQDGCDGFCSYCIIPQIRKNVCNKSVKTILKEAADLVAAGHGEIVLTGIFLGAYGQETVRRKKWDISQKNAFPELVRAVAGVEGLKRLRLSSLEPGDVTDELLDVFCENSNIMPHLHLPLQSGSTAVLRKMCRQYDLEDFRTAEKNIRQRLDRPAITTDIIVGFPGETDEDFEDTMKFAAEMEFAKMHVFSFSPRKGTAAAAMKPAVPSEVIKNRSIRLLELDEKLQEKFASQFSGETVEVLIENVSEGGKIGKGRTGRYFKVQLVAGEADAKLQPDQITETANWTV